MTHYYGTAAVRKFTEGLKPGDRVSQRIRWSDESARITGLITVREATVVSVEPGGHGRVCKLDDGSTFLWAFGGLHYMARSLQDLGRLSDPMDAGATTFLHPGDQDHHELSRREWLKDTLSAVERHIFDENLTADQLHALETAASAAL